MLPVSSEDELWKSGKSDDDTDNESVGEEDTLDLSSPSPEKNDDFANAIKALENVRDTLKKTNIKK